MRVLPVVTLVTGLVLPSLTITDAHPYILGDSDLKGDPCQQCLFENKPAIPERAGIYSGSASEENNFDLTKDEISPFGDVVVPARNSEEEVGAEPGYDSMTRALAAPGESAGEQQQLVARQVDHSVADTVAAQQERLKRLAAQLEALIQRQQGAQSSERTPASPSVKVSEEDLQAWRTEAVRGNAKAQTVLGFLYHQGQGVAQDYVMARQWYEKAAIQGQAEAQLFVGMLYHDGEGGPQDYVQAAKWFEKAAVQGNAGGQGFLGLLYYEGRQGVPQDYLLAAKWYEQAAVQGLAVAQYNLGIMYERGHGVPQDYRKAVQWWERATAQGHASAQFSLGVMYDKGQGVPQDYVVATRWYEQAAAQGHASAQFSLGVMYDRGRGVPQDYMIARQWWEQAAAQGHAKARVNLGFLYGLGHGVPRDPVRSYMWFNLAATQSTGKIQEYSADLRDQTSQVMTHAQIAEAHQLSRQCQAQQFKGC